MSERGAREGAENVGSARQRTEMLEDLDWILDTDSSLTATLAMAVRWPGDQRLREAVRQARADLARRLGMHPQAFDRALRERGRSTVTLRPRVAPTESGARA